MGEEHAPMSDRSALIEHRCAKRSGLGQWPPARSPSATSTFVTSPGRNLPFWPLKPRSGRAAARVPTALAGDGDDRRGRRRADGRRRSGERSRRPAGAAARHRARVRHGAGQRVCSSAPSAIGARWAATSAWHPVRGRVAESGATRASPSRATAIELAWLWLRHQPGSALTRWFQKQPRDPRASVGAVKATDLA